MLKNQTITLLIYFLTNLQLDAQNVEQPNHQVESQPPIPVELFVGDRAIAYQQVINKNIFKDKFNFFNITRFDAELGQDATNVFLISSFFSYNLGKGFSLGVGGELQRPGAFIMLGIQYAYVRPQLLLVLFPSVNLNGTQQYAQLSLIEFRPKITQHLSLYSRVQLLVNTNFKSYDRGYQQIRLGLQHKNIQYGLAATFDQFDSNNITTTNYGVFTRLLIF